MQYKPLKWFIINPASSPSPLGMWLGIVIGCQCWRVHVHCVCVFSVCVFVRERERVCVCIYMHSYLCVNVMGCVCGLMYMCVCIWFYVGVCVCVCDENPCLCSGECLCFIILSCCVVKIRPQLCETSQQHHKTLLRNNINDPVCAGKILHWDNNNQRQPAPHQHAHASTRNHWSTCAIWTSAQRTESLYINH